jgi:hypothetical protein
MSHPPSAKYPPADSRTTALVYEKSFASRGMICGVLVLLGSPFFVLLFHLSVESAKAGLWTKLFPDWLASAMLCIGMVGGALTILLSVLFGLLIPSRVTREGTADADRAELPDRPAGANLAARELSDPTHVE